MQRPTSSSNSSRPTSCTSSPTLEIMDDAQQRLEMMLKAALRVHLERLPSCSDVVEMQSGETKGPFALKTQKQEDNSTVVTLVDQQGRHHHLDVCSSDPILSRIKPCPDPRLANSVAFKDESSLSLLITRDVSMGEDLLAAFSAIVPLNETEDKKFLCNGCNTARFSHLENLTAHQKFYCSKSDNREEQIESPQLPATSSLPLPLMTAPQNILLLPVAYHDQAQHDLVQLLGPPQTIVPVAIGRPPMPPTNPITAPLIIQRSLCSSIVLPSALNFNVGDVMATVPIVQFGTSEKDGASGCRPRAGVRRGASSTSPLDLSKKPRRDTDRSVSDVPSKASTSSDVEKPFTCSCGVSFSAETTLLAHQQFYCKDVARPVDLREPSRKMPSRCSQCEFEPQSLSQLSMHIRAVHSDVQAYVCKVCGYRGYSVRGIRAHMRTHAQLDMLKFDAILENYVAQVKAERKEAVEAEQRPTSAH